MAAMGAATVAWSHPARAAMIREVAPGPAARTHAGSGTHGGSPPASAPIFTDYAVIFQLRGSGLA